MDLDHSIQTKLERGPPKNPTLLILRQRMLEQMKRPVTQLTLLKLVVKSKMVELASNSHSNKVETFTTLSGIWMLVKFGGVASTQP